MKNRPRAASFSFYNPHNCNKVGMGPLGTVFVFLFVMPGLKISLIPGYLLFNCLIWHRSWAFVQLTVVLCLAMRPLSRITKRIQTILRAQKIPAFRFQKAGNLFVCLS